MGIFNKIMSFSFLCVVSLVAMDDQSGSLKMISSKKQERLNTKLIKAVQKSDYKSLDECIVQGADVNMVDKKTGLSPLHVAICDQNVIATHKLLCSRANPNMLWRGRLGPLHIATQQTDSIEKNNAILRLLLDFKADPMLGHFTPLHYATVFQTLPFVKTIVEKADDEVAYALLSQIYSDSTILKGLTNKDLVNYIKQELLINAAKHGQQGIVKKLLQDNIAIDYQDRNGMTALHHAVSNNAEKTSSLLIDCGAPFNIANKNNQFPIDLAGDNTNVKALMHKKKISLDKRLYASAISQFSSVLELEKLLVQGGAINARHGEDNETPFIAAVRKNNHHKAMLFLQYNANIFVTDINGYTALHYAAINNNAQFANTLLNNFLKNKKNFINQQTRDNKRTALHTAVIQKNSYLVCSLLDAKADINIQDVAGNTVLHYAGNDLILLQLLMSKKNNPKLLSNYDNKSALQILRTKEQHAAANFLSKSFGIDAQLIKAAQMGDIAEVISLIGHGANINAIDTNSMSVLSHALRNGHSEIVRTLLRAGVNLDNKCSFSYVKKVEDAQALLDRDCDVNVADKNKVTALIRSCKNNNDKLVKFLLQNKSQVNFVDAEGKTALHYAVQNKNDVIVQMLLEDRADVNMFFQSGETLLQHAIASGASNLLIKLLLFYKADPNTRNLGNEKTALYGAVSKGDVGLVRLLCEHYGSNVNLVDLEGKTPGQYARQLHKKKVEDFFLSKQKQLIDALEEHDIKKVQYLLAHGAHVNRFVDDITIETPLHRAAMVGFVDGLDLLLKNKADIHAQYSFKHTSGSPLHFAAKYNNVACSHILMRAGAVINAFSREGFTPLQLATQFNGSLQSMQYFFDRSKEQVSQVTKNDGSNVLHLALLSNQVKIRPAKVKYLVDQGVNIHHARSSDGKTPLHIAVEQGDDNATRLLVKASASVDVKDKNGNTPLHLAAKILDNSKKGVTIIKYLIDEDADLHAENNHGKTCVRVAFGQQNLKALAVIKSALKKEYECPVCLEKKQPKYIMQLRCKHRCCFHCLTEQVQVANGDHSIDYFKCVDPGCEKIFTRRDIVRFSKKNRELIALFDTVMKKQKLIKKKYLKYCPTPDCGYTFQNKKNSRSQKKCPSCKQKYCSNCLILHEKNVECKTAKQDAATEKWKLENTKSCPSCNRAIEKNNGCNHMTCSQCKNEFCWVCGEKWSFGRGQSHSDYYACNNKKIDGWR